MRKHEGHEECDGHEGDTRDKGDKGWRRRGLIFALLLVPSVVFAQDRIPVLSPGTHDQVLMQKNGAPIHYAIVVPPGYRGEAVPFILALHFGGEPQGAGRAMLDILIEPALGELNAIVVAPDSVGGGWNTAANEQAVNALLAAVEGAYKIDKQKMLVTGYSMGGAGTWYWAGKYPDRFSAAIPVSGRPMTADAQWHLPVFAVHSRNDEVNPIGPTEQRIAELKRAGVNAQLMVLTGISHYQTDRFVNGLRQAVPWVREIWKNTR